MKGRLQLKEGADLLWNCEVEVKSMQKHALKDAECSTKHDTSDFLLNDFMPLVFFHTFWKH